MRSGSGRTGSRGGGFAGGLASGVAGGFGAGVLHALLAPLLFLVLGLGLTELEGGLRGGDIPPRGARGGGLYPGEMVPDAGLPELWLVDGFNVISVGLLRAEQSPGGRDAWWRRERREALLARARGFDDPAAEIWVVFDGSDPRGDAHEGATRTVFAPSADDWLLERVRTADDPERLTVVTADRRLAQRVRARGARVVTPGDFLSRCVG